MYPPFQYLATSIKNIFSNRTEYNSYRKKSYNNCRILIIRG
nr:MAG TPA: hypothetical protein [Caudoviricetes sp.]